MMFECSRLGDDRGEGVVGAGARRGACKKSRFLSCFAGYTLNSEGGEFVDGNVIFVLLNLIVRLFAVMYHFSEANEF